MLISDDITGGVHLGACALLYHMEKIIAIAACAHLSPLHLQNGSISVGVYAKYKVY